jgi:hypothetical protein
VARTSAYAIAAIGAGLAFVAAAAVAIATTPPDQVAVIVNSGSTNTAGFKLTVHASGQSTAIMQNRSGVAQSAVRAFNVSSKDSGTLFADLKAAKAAPPPAQAGCMKSASFGTSTHVQWQGWTSPDLDCPSDEPSIAALKNDVAAIRTAAGISPLPLLHHPAAEGPLHAGSPPP